MPKDSESMQNFRTNVLAIIKNTDGMSISSLVAQLNSRKNKTAVSRTFLTNLLNGHHSCSIPFAEDIADVLGISLPTLLKAPRQKNLQRTA